MPDNIVIVYNFQQQSQQADSSLVRRLPCSGFRIFVRETSERNSVQRKLVNIINHNDDVLLAVFQSQKGMYIRKELVV